MKTITSPPQKVGIPIDSLAPLRKTTWRDHLRYAIHLPWNWTYSVLHTIYETYVVVNFMRKLKAGLLDVDHPWVTGIKPDTDEFIWPDNIVYRSPLKKGNWGDLPPDSDEEIVIKVGRFLTNMVKKSLPSNPEITQGPKRRMPHAVNYLHGPVHYNSGFILLNDFADVVYHFTDPKFVREIKRFASEAQRELIIVIRERKYEPEEYAWCLGCIRAHLPWYANANGPTKKGVLFGTPSPYPAVNPINGIWAKFVEYLYTKEFDKLCLPPIQSDIYFQEVYQGTRRHYTWLERYHAWSIYWQIKVRGFQGPLVFTPRRRIEPQKLEEFKKVGWWNWQSVYKISNPFFKRMDKN